MVGTSGTKITIPGVNETPSKQLPSCNSYTSEARRAARVSNVSPSAITYGTQPSGIGQDTISGVGVTVGGVSVAVAVGISAEFVSFAERVASAWLVDLKF